MAHAVENAPHSFRFKWISFRRTKIIEVNLRQSMIHAKNTMNLVCFYVFSMHSCHKYAPRLLRPQHHFCFNSESSELQSAWWNVSWKKSTNHSIMPHVSDVLFSTIFYYVTYVSVYYLCMLCFSQLETLHLHHFISEKLCNITSCGTTCGSHLW